MILYINGDSNAAGAEAVNTHAFAEDDSQYWRLGRKPHPDNESVCWGTVLANRLGWDRYNDSESAASNYRILRTTLQYLENNTPDAIVIGWTTWEREEWYVRDEYYQITASGTDAVPPDLKDRYREWVASHDEDMWRRKNHEWHDKIWSLHQNLIDKKIPHIFFNSYSEFLWIPESDRYDWQNYYVSPYDYYSTYYDWLIGQGVKTAYPGSYHFGPDGHQKWADFLYPQLTRLL